MVEYRRDAQGRPVDARGLLIPDVAEEEARSAYFAEIAMRREALMARYLSAPNEYLAGRARLGVYVFSSAEEWLAAGRDPAESEPDIMSAVRDVARSS